VSNTRDIGNFRFKLLEVSKPRLFRGIRERPTPSGKLPLAIDHLS
jgi:hypothetical protein